MDGDGTGWLSRSSCCCAQSYSHRHVGLCKSPISRSAFEGLARWADLFLVQRRTAFSANHSLLGLCQDTPRGALTHTCRQCASVRSGTADMSSVFTPSRMKFYSQILLIIYTEVVFQFMEGGDKERVVALPLSTGFLYFVYYTRMQWL